jgi:serine/threonine protein kinase
MEAGNNTSWSPRLVRLYGYELGHQTPFLVYEHVPGGDLVRWLAAHQARTGRGPTPAEVLEWIIQVAEALAFAHERGLVHRDLKPANVLVADKTIKLADFGIGGVAARQAAQVSRIGTGVASQLSPAEQASLFRGAGTPLYMSPEQRRGADPDPRHDLYSLGVMWYQLLVGDVTREMGHGWADELVEDHAVPAGHVEAIKKCVGLFKHRPENAGKLLEVLRGFAPRSPKPPPPTGDKAEALRNEVVRALVAECQRRPVVRWVFGGLFGFLALLFAWLGIEVFVTGERDPNRPWIVVGVALPGLLSVWATVALIGPIGPRKRQTRKALIQAIDSAKDSLSLPGPSFDPDNRKSLLMAGWDLVSDIQKRHLQRNTSAQVHLAGSSWEDKELFKVLLDGELLGEGSLAHGFDLPAKLCRGLHYLKVMRIGWKGVSFDINRDGNCRIEVIDSGGLRVEVFWSHLE